MHYYMFGFIPESENSDWKKKIISFFENWPEIELYGETFRTKSGLKRNFVYDFFEQFNEMLSISYDFPLDSDRFRFVLIDENGGITSFRLIGNEGIEEAGEKWEYRIFMDVDDHLYRLDKEELIFKIKDMKERLCSVMSERNRLLIEKRRE